MTSTDEIYETVRGALAELFGLDPGRITPQSRLAEDLELDSIDAVDLVDHMRRITGRKVAAEDFRSVRTVADLVHATERVLRA